MTAMEKHWVSVSMPYVTRRERGQRDAWAEEASRYGRTGTHRLREVAEVVPPAEVAEALRVDAGEKVVVRRRLILLDDEPVELADSYYPASLARGTGLAESRKIPGGAVTLLAELGYRLRQVQEDACARRPTVAERELLRLGGQDWVLGLVRIAMADGGLPVEASMITMVAEGRRLRYQLSVD